MKLRLAVPALVLLASCGRVQFARDAAAMRDVVDEPRALDAAGVDAPLVDRAVDAASEAVDDVAFDALSEPVERIDVRDVDGTDAALREVSANDVAVDEGDAIADTRPASDEGSGDVHDEGTRDDGGALDAEVEAGDAALDGPIDDAPPDGLVDAGRVYTPRVIPYRTFVGTFDDGDRWSGSHDHPWPADAPFVVGRSGKIYAGFYRGFLTSTDDGTTWTFVDLSEAIPRSTLFTVPTVLADESVLFVSVVGLGVLRSTDGGAHFTFVPELAGFAAFTGSWAHVNVLQPAEHPSEVVAFASHETGFATRLGSVFLSRNGGSTFQSLDASLLAGGCHGSSGGPHPIAFDPTDEQRFWVANMQDGICETRNGGASFTLVPGAMLRFGTAVERVRTPTGVEQLVYTGACSPARYATVDSWSWADATGDERNCGTSPYVLAHPFDRSIVVSAHYALFASSDGGRTFTASGLALPTGQLPGGVVVDPYRARRFLTALIPSRALYESVDGGATFHTIGTLP